MSKRTKIALTVASILAVVWLVGFAIMELAWPRNDWVVRETREDLSLVKSLRGITRAVIFLDCQTWRCQTVQLDCPADRRSLGRLVAALKGMRVSDRDYDCFSSERDSVIIWGRTPGGREMRPKIEGNFDPAAHP